MREIVTPRRIAVATVRTADGYSVDVSTVHNGRFVETVIFENDAPHRHRDYVDSHDAGLALARESTREELFRPYDERYGYLDDQD